MNPLLPNTSATANRAQVVAISNRMDDQRKSQFLNGNLVVQTACIQRVNVIDFYRSPAMDEKLMELQEDREDHSEHVLELVRNYGAACRVHGVGEEVTKAFKAVVEAVTGVPAC